ncbi:MAG: hypothetical protein U1B78_04870, partial [Dehalococcoidia bacterium]|nr:hypothetical protein [Dehalococcoidia bacterium]
VVFGEDAFVQSRFQGRPTIYESGGMPGITPEWAQALKMDLSTFQEYAEAVFAATDSYLANLPNSELERKVQGVLGEYTLGWGLAILLVQHEAEHSGEIAALKGVQGLKGLPY